MKLHIRNTDPGHIKAFLTLTYPREFPADGRKIKRDLDAMLKFLKRQGVHAGIWFWNFSHVVHRIFTRSSIRIHPVALMRLHAWHRIVGTQDKKHYLWHAGKLSGRPCLEYLRVPHAASAYATKYATKQEQKQVPVEFFSVGRFWGCWGDARPVWRYISGRGGYSRETAGKAIINHRAQFSTIEQLDEWARRAYFSCVMWGAAVTFDDLLSSVCWCPF